MYLFRKNTVYLVTLLAAMLIISCGKKTPEPQIVEPQTNALPIEVEEPQLSAGLTEAEFIAIAGAPNGEVVNGDKKVLYYNGVLVTVADGRVIEVPPHFKTAVAEARQELKAEKDIRDEYRKKGYVRHDGKWMMPYQRDRLIEAEKRKNQRAIANRKSKSYSSPQPRVSKEQQIGYVLYRVSGEPVYHDMVSSGYITVVIFHSNRYCYRDYSRQLIGKLQACAKKNARIRISQVDVRYSSSDIAGHYGVTYIPEVRVFGKDKKMIGTPTSNYEVALSYINFANEN